MQKKKLVLTLIVGIAVMLLGQVSPKLVSAAVCKPGESPATVKCDPPVRAIDCPSGKVDSSDASKCVPLGNGCSKTDTADACLQKNPIVTNLNNIIDFLSAGVGIVVIAVIIIGGIQYTLAGDNSSATQAAKQRITNGLIALFAFLFIFAFLQWIIPGGL